MKREVDATYIEMFGLDAVDDLKKTTTLPDIPGLDTLDTDLKKASPGWYKAAAAVEHEQLLDDLAPLEKVREYAHIPALQKVEDPDEQQWRENERLFKRATTASRKAYLSQKFNHYYRPDIRERFNEVISKLAEQKELSGKKLKQEFMKLISN